MGTTFVNIGEKGFWVHDSLLEVWLRLLALQLREPNDNDTPTFHAVMRDIRDQWLLASKGFFGGCIPVALEKAVSTKDGKSLVRDAATSLLQSLSHGPTVLHRSTLSLLGYAEGGYTFDIETQRIIKVGNAFLELLDGKINSKVGDQVRMPGSD